MLVCCLVIDMPIKEIKNGWKVNVTRKGKRFIKLVTTSLEDAQKLEELAIFRLSNGIPMDLEVSQQETTMQALFRLTDALRWSKHRSDSQRKTAQVVIQKLNCEKCQIKDILNNDKLMNFEIQCTNEGLSLATIDKYKSALKAMIEIAHTKGFIDHKPELKHSGQARRRIQYFTKEQEANFLKHCLNYEYKELHDIAMFSIDTGCRASELLSLEAKHYHDKAILFKDTKNGDDRLIPLTDRANLIILERLKFQGKLFKLSYEQLKYQWRKIRESLELDSDYCYHVCRHTFATRLLQAGNASPMVQKLTGHRDANSLGVYSHANMKHLEQMIQTIN